MIRRASFALVPLALLLAAPEALAQLPPLEAAKLLASDGASGNLFGTSCAVSGETVVVGAQRGDGPGGTDTGSVYVFRRPEGGPDAWGETVELVPTGVTPGDRFGQSVAIWGDTVVVGAPLADGANTVSGAAFVFERNTGGPNNWGEVAVLLASDGESWDAFGHAVAISIDTVVVGVPYDEDLGQGSGAAYVYRRDEGGPDNWGEEVKLVPADGAALDNFGYSVAILEERVAVGAPWDEQAGSAYTFDRDQGGPGSWGEVAKYGPAAIDDEFGLSVALANDYVAVGAPGDDELAPGAGAVHLYGPTDVKVFASDGADDDRFGSSVAASGNALLVGSPWDDDVGSGSGSAHLFFRHEGGRDTWGEFAKLAAGDATVGDLFGDAVGLSGWTLAVGAPSADVAGAAYVFDGIKPPPDELVELAGNDTGGSHQLGSALALDGDLLLVGAPWTDSAYLFRRDQGGPDAWGEVAQLVGSVGTDFGAAVALHGRLVVIGAPYGGGFPAEGEARVYLETSPDVWTPMGTLYGSLSVWPDRFGDSLAAYWAEPETGFILVGAPHKNTDWGMVYTFETDGLGGWWETDRLQAIGGGVFQEFGHALAFTGAPGQALIGTWMDGAGSVRIFERDSMTSTWSEIDELRPSDGLPGDLFGASISVDRGLTSDLRIVVGAPGTDDHGVDSGSAYVFRDDGGMWTEAAKLSAADAAVGDGFGTSVSIRDADVTVVGAPLDDDAGLDSGAAYIFYRIEKDDWSQANKIVSADAAPGDELGYAVALASGDRAVLGAPMHDDLGADAGAAYVFGTLNWRVATSYCTAGTTSSGCRALIASAGSPSATAASGFDLIATGVEGDKTGLFFYGASGRHAFPWGNGTSYHCVRPPVKRSGLIDGAGTSGACDGVFAVDLNARWCPTCPKPAHNPGVATVVQTQLWYRDPFNTSNMSTALSDALEFTVGP